jgi:hypothetical protein
MNQVFKIGSSENLDVSQSVLLMEIGETHCCFGIADHATKILRQLFYFTVDEKDDGNIFQMILEKHLELKNSFHQVIIGYYLPENILIPLKFYRSEQTESILQSVYDKGQNFVISESLFEWQMYNAYNVPVNIHKLVATQFTGGQFWHVHSISLKNKIEPEENGSLLIDFKTESFSVIVLKGNSLLLSQIYSYVTAEDVLYYLLKICKQFSLSQDEVKLKLTGLIDKQSAVFKELYQYFLNLEFSSHGNELQPIEEFSEYPAHFFTSFFKLASCVS